MTDLLKGLTPAKVALINKSGVLKDPGKMADLEGIIPEDRQNVLIQHVSMGVDWADAIAGATPNSDHESPDLDKHEANANRVVQRWRLDALKPNPWNAKLFSRSMEPEQIKVLAENIDRNGLRTPIEILADGTRLDGNRRCLAQEYLGWDMTDVVVVADSMSDAEILRYIVDAATSQRVMSVREQVMVFEAQLELERLADPQNEDRNRSPNLDPQNEDRPDPKDLRDAAARRAGFRSYETARRARRVFREGDAETQRLLESGEFSVNAAHDRLPPRRSSTRVKVIAPTDDELSTNVDENPFAVLDEATRSTNTTDDNPTAPPKKYLANKIDLTLSSKQFEDQSLQGVSRNGVEDAIATLVAHIEQLANNDIDTAEQEVRRIHGVISAPVKRARKRLAA